MSIQTGDRVMLISMTDDPDPIQPGEIGTVGAFTTSGFTVTQVFVHWDSGRSLALIEGKDEYVVLPGGLEEVQAMYHDILKEQEVTHADPR